jgi:hypothetical protein
MKAEVLSLQQFFLLFHLQAQRRLILMPLVSVLQKQI